MIPNKVKRINIEFGDDPSCEGRIVSSFSSEPGVDFALSGECIHGKRCEHLEIITSFHDRLNMTVYEMFCKKTSPSRHVVSYLSTKCPDNRWYSPENRYKNFLKDKK